MRGERFSSRQIAFWIRIPLVEMLYSAHTCRRTLSAFHSTTPLVFFLREFFPRALLSERLEQVKIEKVKWNGTFRLHRPNVWLLFLLVGYKRSGIN